MFWARIPTTMTTIKTVSKTILTGSAFALTTTAFSCGLAIAIEGAAHRTLYYIKPEWYEGVTYAYGLPQLQHAQHDAHHVSEVSGAVATSHEHDEEQRTILEEDEIPAENKLAWNNTDETVFSTAIDVQKEREERRRQEEDKKEQDTFSLATADRLVAHVFSTALTC